MFIETRNKDIIASYLNIIVSLCSNILLLPILIYYLNANILGIWYVFVSIGGIVSLLDFGFNPAIARVVSYAWCGCTCLKKENIAYF